MLFQVAICVCMLGLAHAYPKGNIPNSACEDMVPTGHQTDGKPEAQTSAVYKIEVPSTYEANKNFTIKINGGETKFKGFYIQARDSNNKRVGRFVAFGDNTQGLTCTDKMKNDAAAHKGPLDLTNLELKWRAPDKDVGDIKFKATIVQEKLKFWVGIESNVVKYPSGASCAKLTPILLFAMIVAKFL